jgi:hypothetical protein
VARGVAPTCDVCGASHWADDAQIYCAMIRVGNERVAKLGITVKGDKRPSSLPVENGCIELLRVIAVNGSKKNAVQRESAIKLAFADDRLPRERGRLFVTSGFTECFEPAAFKPLWRAVRSVCGPERDAWSSGKSETWQDELDVIGAVATQGQLLEILSRVPNPDSEDAKEFARVLGSMHRLPAVLRPGIGPRLRA